MKTQWSFAFYYGIFPSDLLAHCYRDDTGNVVEKIFSFVHGGVKLSSLGYQITQDDLYNGRALATCITLSLKASKYVKIKGQLHQSQLL